MPERTKSQQQLIKDMEKQLKDHARDVYSRTIEPILSQRGYALVNYLDGEISSKRSKDLREQLMTLGMFVDDNVEIMESGAIPDLVIKDKNGKYVALIEVTSTSTIEVRKKGIIRDIEKFAQVWEQERESLKINLPQRFSLDRVVKIVEAY